MPNVCHFLRKSSQLRASFINNQISNHIRYSPSCIYRLFRDKEFDGGYAEFNKALLKLDLSKNQTTYEKILYLGPKLLSNSQINKAQSFLKNHNIQFAHFHYGTDCGIFYPLVNKMNIPSIVSFYGYDISSFPKFMKGYGKEYLKNRVFNRVDAILAMSPDMKNDLIEAGCPEKKIIVHYYGTDCEKFYHTHKYLKKELITILTLSNLCSKKGHVFQFEALKELIKSGFGNFQMRVAGSGNLDRELKQFVEQNGLSAHVHFLGALNYGSKEMIEEYKNADIFLHPSVTAPDGDKEGIPGTIIEAMSAGLPVIATFHAGIPYIIKNNMTGILVNEWDVEALMNALKQLIENRNLREEIGLKAQRYAIENLGLLDKEKELEEIYDSIISKKNINKSQ